MTDPTAPLLSDLADRLTARTPREPAPGTPGALDPAVLVLGTGQPAAPTDRRACLARASALSLAIPGVGAALAACSTQTPQGAAAADSARQGGGTAGAAGAGARQPHNSDSRLDSAVLKGE